jgi:hypothetical protein
MVKKVLFRRLILLKFLWFGILYTSPLNGQETKVFRDAEDTLHRISALFANATEDSARRSLNNRFLSALTEAINLPGSFEYPFDSLKTLGKLTSPDRYFRIYNWNLPHKDGSNTYFCLLQVNDPEYRRKRLFTLTDRSSSLLNPEQQILDTSEWYGSLYYNIIRNVTDTGDSKSYTLLGWDGKSATITQKVIEIITFDRNGIPHFGARIFKNFADGHNARVIFRYSSSARMTLKYDEQTLPAQINLPDGMNPRKFAGKKKSILVFDRLIPMDPQLKDQYQFYVPAAEVYDGFLFLDNSWIFITGIDARNKAKPRVKKR